jgi:hypothetical protein
MSRLSTKTKTNGSFRALKKLKEKIINDDQEKYEKFKILT